MAASEVLNRRRRRGQRPHSREIHGTVRARRRGEFPSRLQPLLGELHDRRKRHHDWPALGLHSCRVSTGVVVQPVLAGSSERSDLAAIRCIASADRTGRGARFPGSRLTDRSSARSAELRARVESGLALAATGALGRPAAGAELGVCGDRAVALTAGLTLWGAAVTAKTRSCGDRLRALDASRRRSRCGRGLRSAHRAHHRLPHGDPGAAPDARSGSASGVIGRRLDRFGSLKPSEAAHVSDDAHAGALIEHLLDFGGERNVFHVELGELQPVAPELVFQLGLGLAREFVILRSQVERRGSFPR